MSSSSVFTSLVTDTIPVPHDKGQTVKIRKLAPRHLEQAAKAQQRKSLDDLKAIGGAAFLRELKELGEGTTQAAVSADPMLLYDRLTLMDKGVVAWSYDIAPTVGAYEDLDEDTAEWLGRVILKLAKPSLFQTEEQADEEKKVGAPGFIVD